MSNPVQILQANANKGRQPKNFHELVHVTVAKGITPGQLNSGYTLINNFGGGVEIRPVGFLIIVNSAAVGAVTDIRLSSLESTPTDIVTIAVANLTLGAKLDQANANAVLGAGFGAVLPIGYGVQLRKTGASATGAFTIDVYFFYDLRG